MYSSIEHLVLQYSAWLKHVIAAGLSISSSSYFNLSYLFWLITSFHVSTQHTCITGIPSHQCLRSTATDTIIILYRLSANGYSRMWLISDRMNFVATWPPPICRLLSPQSPWDVHVVVSEYVVTALLSVAQIHISLSVSACFYVNPIPSTCLSCWFPTVSCQINHSVICNPKGQHSVLQLVDLHKYMAY